MVKRSKNRKNRKKHVEIPYPGPLLSVLICSAAIALGYLWVCGRCEELGEEIGQLEQYRTEISQRLNIEKSKWARNETMEGIKRGLARWGIEMELPPPERVVVVQCQELLEELAPMDRQGDQYAYVAQSGYE